MILGVPNQRQATKGQGIFTLGYATKAVGSSMEWSYTCTVHA